MQEKQDQAAKRRDAKERELEKATQKLRKVASEMVPMNAVIDGYQREIEQWLAAQPKEQAAEAVLKSIDDIRAREQVLQSRGRGVSVDSIQRKIAADERSFRQKEGQMQLPEGGIETVNARFREQERKMKDLNRQIALHDHNNQILMAAHKEHSKRYRDLRAFLEDSAKDLFIQNLLIKDYVGKLEFDHEKKTLVSSVDVNTRSGPRAHDAFGGHKQLSGGENSYSNVCLLLALSAISTCPWQVLDEFDVFMCAGACVRRAHIPSLHTFAGTKTTARWRWSSSATA